MTYLLGEEAGFKPKESGSGIHAPNYSTLWPLKVIPLPSLGINHCPHHLLLLFLALPGTQELTYTHCITGLLCPLGLSVGGSDRRSECEGREKLGSLFPCPLLQGHHRLVNCLGEMPHSPCQVAVSTTFSLPVWVTSLSPCPPLNT